MGWFADQARTLAKMVRGTRGRPSPRRLRAESFGAIAQLTVPRALVFVDREFARSLGVTESPLWSDAAADGAIGRTVLAAPLRGTWQVLGVLAAARPADRPFGAEDVEVMTTLCAHAGTALENARRYREVREADRRKDDFLARLAHELRNPLAPIVNAVSIMRMEAIGSQRLRDARDVIGRQVEQMRRLVDDLLDIGRITSGKINLESRPFPLIDAVRQAVEAVSPAIREKSHALNLEIEDAGLWIQGDSARIVQVFVNLLGNAAKFTDAGGRIDVRVARAGGFAEVTVRDNGPGVAPGRLPAIFDMFVQGGSDDAADGSGLGLGLSVVRQMVTLHGGHVSAYSAGQPGRGCEFVVSLPAIEPPASQLGTNGEAPAAVALQVLVVDDNADSAQSFAMLLELMGHHVRVVHGGLGALDRLACDPCALGQLGLSPTQESARRADLAPESNR